MAKLKKGDITLREVYLLSLSEYKKQGIDDKKRRAGLDVLYGKLIGRNNLQFDRSEKKWKQVGREIKLVFKIKTDPISYTKNDTVKIHSYDVTFLIKDYRKGVDSPFRSRVGSNKKPVFPKKGASPEERLKIINNNIKNGIQLQSYFESQFTFKILGILFGPCHAKMPKRTNAPVYWSKHELFIFEKMLVPLLTKGQAKLNQILKNENRAKKT